MKINQKDCIKDIVVYQKREKRRSGGIMFIPLIGIPSEKEGYIHEIKGRVGEHDGFKDKPTKIPKGAKKFKRTKHRYNDDWAKAFYCKKPKTKKQIQKEKTIKKRLVGSVNTARWFKKSRKYWLKIKDIEKMKKGDKKEILMLDRNVWDGLDKRTTNKPYESQKFFAHARASFEYLGDMKMKLTYKVGKKKETTELEFHINYRLGYWYPLKDGFLPEKDLQKFHQLLGKKKHWTKFPKGTCVGFRGAFIEWPNLKKLPKVFIPK
tara:strand:- start:5826 stop:6617 length:792 start_codon:yes stop_codon:yes gene_type:complete